MSIYSKLYWLTRLDSIQALLVVVLSFLILAIIIIVLNHFISSDFDEFHHGDDLARRKKSRSRLNGLIKPFAITSLIISLFIVFLPSKKDVIFIVAGGKTIEFIQNDTSINKIPEQTTKYISEFLEQQINDLEGKNKPDSEKE